MEHVRKKIKSKLSERNMSISALSLRVGVSRTTLTKTLSGEREFPRNFKTDNWVRRLEDELGIEEGYVEEELRSYTNKGGCSLFQKKELLFDVIRRKSETGLPEASLAPYLAQVMTSLCQNADDDNPIASEHNSEIGEYFWLSESSHMGSIIQVDVLQPVYWERLSSFSSALTAMRKLAENHLRKVDLGGGRLYLLYGEEIFDFRYKEGSALEEKMEQITKKVRGGEELLENLFNAILN